MSFPDYIGNFCSCLAITKASLLSCLPLTVSVLQWTFNSVHCFPSVIINEEKTISLENLGCYIWHHFSIILLAPFIHNFIGIALALNQHIAYYTLVYWSILKSRVPFFSYSIYHCLTFSSYLFWAHFNKHQSFFLNLFYSLHLTSSVYHFLLLWFQFLFLKIIFITTVYYVMFSLSIMNVILDIVVILFHICDIIKFYF